MYKIITSVLCLCALLIFNINIALAQVKAENSSIPTKVLADTMNYDSANSTVVFTGKVEIQREEFQLWADHITVYLNTNQSSSGDPMASLQSGEINRIIAEENVRMKYNTNTGSCGRAIYEATQSLLIMQENPVLKEGVNSLTGEEIRYYMTENRSEIIGGTKRVEAIFSSDEAL